MNNEGIHFEQGSATSQKITRENRSEFNFMWKAIEDGVRAVQPISDHDKFEVAIDDLMQRHEHDLFDAFIKNRARLVAEVISLMNSQKDVEHADVTGEHLDDHGEDLRKVAA